MNKQSKVVLYDVNNPQYQYLQGRKFYYGFDSAIDMPEAYRWFQLAAKQGCKNSMNYLGAAYRRGEYVNKDLEMAFYWYTQSYQAGNEVALFNLAKMFFIEPGIQDFVTAKKYLSMAAQSGDWPSQVWLRLFGDDTKNSPPKNLAEAQQTYLTEATNGNVNSQYLLAFYLYFSDTDEMQALDCYQRAAEQGHAAAQHWLAAIYNNELHPDLMYNGSQIVIDTEKMTYWMNKSLDQDYEQAWMDFHFLTDFSSEERLFTEEEISHWKHVWETDFPKN